MLVLLLGLGPLPVGSAACTVEGRELPLEIPKAPVCLQRVLAPSRQTPCAATAQRLSPGRRLRLLTDFDTLLAC